MRLPANVRLRKLAIGAGYGGFALLALLVSLYLTFPAEAVGQRVAHEVRSRTGGQFDLSFGSVAPYRLSGFSAKDEHQRAGRPGQQPLDLVLDGLRVRLRLLPLLLFRLSGAGGIDLGDGSIEAAVTDRGPGALDADLDVDDLNLASPPLLPRLVGLSLGGKLAGEARTAWRPDVKSSTGHARFELKDAVIGPGQVQGFTIPQTELGTITPELVIENGRLRVASFKQEGGQVQLKVSGTVQLRPQVEQSMLDLCILVKPDAAYLAKNPTVASALDLASQVRFRRDAQGFLNIPLGGTLSSPMPRNGLCHTSGR